MYQDPGARKAGVLLFKVIFRVVRKMGNLFYDKKALPILIKHNIYSCKPFQRLAEH